MEDLEAIPPACWPVDYLRQLDRLLTREGRQKVAAVQAAWAAAVPGPEKQPISPDPLQLINPEPPALRLRPHPEPPEAA